MNILLINPPYAAPLPTEKVISEARLFGAAIAGFATYSQNMTEVYGLCLALKKSLPGLKTVLGGLYASFLPQQCLKENPVDFVGSGTAVEKPFKNFHPFDGTALSTEH